MKSAPPSAELKKRLQFPRFKDSTIPFTLNNGNIYSFAINEITSELLYADNHGIHLIAVMTNEEVRTIPYTDLIKQEISRYSERKQQEILAAYSSHGIQYLNIIQTQNVWLGVVSRKKFVFFSEDLAVSNESPIDISGITSLKVNPETGDIFTLTGDGKILMWGSEVLSDTGKKRSTEFDVKIIMKKKFAIEGMIVKFDIAWGICPYIAGVGETTSNAPPTVHLWEYSTGEKLQSIVHSEGYSVQITAVGLRHKYLVLLDSARNLSVYDLSSLSEVHKRNLGPSVSQVDSILIEENELNAGVYLMDYSGRVIDYSVTNAIVLSTYTHVRAKESLVVMSQRTGGKEGQVSPRGMGEERMAPGSAMSRFNTCFRVITRYTGLTQLWALYDGVLSIVSLASTGRIVEIGGDIAQIRKFQYTQAAPRLFPIPGLSSIIEVQMDNGAIGLIPSSLEKPPKLHSDFLEVIHKRGEVPGVSHITIDFSSTVSVSNSGGLLCYDYKTKIYSQDCQLSKIIVTALCCVPKYLMGLDGEGDDSNQLDIIIGTDSGVIFVHEYNPRKRTFEAKKRYAGHDVVVAVEYRPWDRKVLTAGRDGYIKFLLCDRYYEWDSTSYKGYWNDCTACTICGRAMVLLGYESGMLQTLYFSPTSTYPTNALLEYHTTKITTVCGLDLSLSEGVSGDDSGNMVLWNLETSEPLKVFLIYSPVDAILAFGTERCETLLATFNGSLLHLYLDRSTLYRKVTKRDVLAYKTESKKRRFEGKKKASRPGSLYGSKRKPTTRPGTISDLYNRVQETKDRISPDPVEAVKTKIQQGKSVEEESVAEAAGKTVDEKYKERALHQIIEKNHIERFKKSLAMTIKHCNEWVPRELLFNGRFKTRSIVVTPCGTRFPDVTRSPTSVTHTEVSKLPSRERKFDEPESVYMTRSLTHVARSFLLSSPKSTSRSLLSRDD